jgi:adenosylmethionine-8-amino-7-oxononanoate aminotransferase
MTTTAARDARYVWHPFTQHAVWADEPPLAIASGHGPYLVDEDGREYLDGCSSLWVTVHGHREPAIDDAIRAQLGKVAHSTFLGLTHEPAVALAERLIRCAPTGLTRVFYAGDGSSAVEAALKMAYQAACQRGESRPRYVSVEHGYHGDTLGAVAVGGIDVFHAAYRPLLMTTTQVPSPYFGVDASLAALRATLDTDVCAVVVEPLVQAAGGMLTHDPAFLRGVRALCDEYGALMLADEVATGVGRTGTMWACEQAGVAPDLLTCGKGLSGGYLPIAAVLATEAVYDAFLGRPEDGRTFFHGHTYTANPLACAASVANLDLMAERGTVAHAAALGERLATLLEPLRANESVHEIRRAGTMAGIDLRRPDGAPYDPSLRLGWRVCRLARDRGVLIRPLGDVVVLMPPLALPDAEAKTLAEVTAACIADVVAGLA